MKVEVTMHTTRAGWQLRAWREHAGMKPGDAARAHGVDPEEIIATERRRCVSVDLAEYVRAYGPEPRRYVRRVLGFMDPITYAKKVHHAQ